MAPKGFHNDPSEVQAAPRKGKTPPRDPEAAFREALASGEIDGDTVMLDERGNEVKDVQPGRTIFDL